jgi:Na+:H+ antiporter
LIIEIVREGMVSPGVAEALLSNIEALAEAARSEGRIGYKSASDETLGHRIGFHVALFLYRRLGLVRMLADRLRSRRPRHHREGCVATE